MPSDAERKQVIRARVVELARRFAGKSPAISDDDILLETGLFDSASILELLVWLETQFDIEFEPDELSLDNFGSINRMSEFLSIRRGG